jgi:CRISPR-associated protein Cmr6
MPVRSFNLHKDLGVQNPDTVATTLRQLDRGHHGLRYDRYFGQWDAGDPGKLLKEIPDPTGPNRPQLAVDPLHEWLDPDFARGNRGRHPVELFCGQRDLIAEYLERRSALVTAATGAMFSARLLTPLAIGLGRPHPKENGGMTWHYTLGVPYLPASGLKQIAREMAMSGWSSQSPDAEKELEGLFGSDKSGVGSVIILDGLPGEPVVVTSEVTTSHYKPYYEQRPQDPDLKAPGDWFKPNPVTFPVVSAGALYHFAVLPRRPQAPTLPRDLRRALFWLMEGLEILGAGAKTGAAGLGRFAPLPAAL